MRSDAEPESAARPAAAKDGAGSLSEVVVESYARDGVVVVRQLLDSEEVELARAGVEAVLAAPSALANVASGADDPGLFVEDFRRWQEVAEIGRLAQSSRAPAVAGELLRTDEVRLYHDHVLVKESGTKERTPWHQDQPYYNVDGRGVSAWIPLDHVPLEGSLELLAGSHSGEWLMPRSFLDKEAKWFPEGSLAELPDVDAQRERFDVRSYELAPGDAIFFDFLTVHGAPGFPFGGRRRVLSLRYLSSDARHAPRTWRTSPPFEELAGSLQEGAPMDHPLFPVVWRRNVA